jgi:hypothetical protein
VNCGPRSNFLYIAITCLLYSHTITIFHSIRSFLYFKQTGVGDIPNRYNSDVVLNQQARVAHQGWYGGFVIPGGPVAEVATAVLDASAYDGSLDRSMADPESGPWWTTDDKPMADSEMAHGWWPYSARIGFGLGLQVVSAPVPTCSPCQAPL